MARMAVVLLHYWRAVGQGRRRSWYALGVAAALLLLFIGIHNSWDTVTYIALNHLQSPNENTEEP